jgi:hypothetical protein
MDQDNKAKAANTTAPQSSETNTEAPSAVVRNLGLIKAMAIIMAILIVAALAVIIVTIYSRLTAANSAKAIQQSELVIPADSRLPVPALALRGKCLSLSKIKPASNYGSSTRQVKFSAKPASRPSSKNCQSRNYCLKTQIGFSR